MTLGPVKKSSGPAMGLAMILMHSSLTTMACPSLLLLRLMDRLRELDWRWLVLQTFVLPCLVLS